LKLTESSDSANEKNERETSCHAIGKKHFQLEGLFNRAEI